MHLPITRILILAALAIWALALLVFVVPTPAISGVGAGFLEFGILMILLHRPLGRLMFSIGRVVHLNALSWGEAGQEGAQAWYLGIGTMLVVVGCIYLVRALV